MSLTLDEVKALIAPKSKAAVIPQNGPLRWYDHEMRCASRGCSSSTYCKVEHVPYCMKHALEKLNNLVIQVTELRRADVGVGNHRTDNGDMGAGVDRGVLDTGKTVSQVKV